MLYDAVLDDTLWSRALQATSDFTGGNAVGHVSVIVDRDDARQVAARLGLAGNED